jgi:hypothetical protein
MLKCRQADKTNKLHYPPYKIHNILGNGVRTADIGNNIISPSAGECLWVSGNSSAAAHPLHSNIQAPGGWQSSTVVIVQARLS